MLLTGGTLAQLIFWTILLAWLTLRADTITVMQLCCCCRCRLALLFFPCALQFAFEAHTRKPPPPPPSQVNPPGFTPGTGRQVQAAGNKRVTRACIAHARASTCAHVHKGITRTGISKTSRCAKVLAEKASWPGKASRSERRRAGARRGTGAPRKAAVNPHRRPRREGARGIGTVTAVSLAKSPSQTWHFGHRG